MKYNVKNKSAKPVAKKMEEPKLNLIYALVLLGYAFITVLTPNMNTLDSNGPKFYTLAIMNLVAYLIILSGNKLKPREGFHWLFFRNRIGIIYTLFLLVSLLSFFKAFNIYESIINFAKLFTIFSAAYIVSIILCKDKRYLYIISVSLAFLLIFDSMTVFYHILTYKLAVQDVIISEIKSIYSNKNILTAAIFIKISFSLWLLTFGKTWMKFLGGFALFISLLAILFMNTRSFFLGSIFLLFFYGLFMMIRFYKTNEKRRILFGAIYLAAAVIIVFILFTVSLNYIYPDSNRSGYRVFIERLKTIPQELIGNRGQALRHSYELIKKNPFLGIGTGNWKIEVLKYETPTTGAYIFMYKCHNDFMETTADIGIFGGAMFLGIFVLIFANFIKAFFKAKKGEEDSYKWLFLPAFGLFCYSFDAMFNFPSDRPEIISFFAIFVGAGIAYSPSIKRIPFFGSKSDVEYIQNNQPIKRKPSTVTLSVPSILLVTLFFSLMLGSVYVFYLNFKSLKLQRIIKQEMIAGAMTTKSEVFLEGFPAIPDISIEGEPIAVSKSRYLVAEEKYQQAIDLLKTDNSSPYDTRQEFFIALSYLKMGQFDSALVYANKVYKFKPMFSGNVSVLSSAYEAKGNLEEALKVLEDHIKFNTQNGQPIADVIYQQQASLSPRVKIQKYPEIYNKALEAFTRKDYNNSIRYFSDFIDKEPGLAVAFEYRAFCYFYLAKYQLSLDDIEKAIALDPAKPGYINLRGINKHFMGNDPAACEDFQTAINMGDKDAVTNFARFCKKQ